MTYDQLKQQIEADSEIARGSGARPEEIEHAEAQLGVRFPRNFRRFLQDFGWLEGHQERVFGLGRDVPDDQDLVREALAARHEFRPYLPPELIPLRNDGAGNIYALDTGRGSEEPPVVLWDHEFDEDQAALVDEDLGFVAWLAHLIEFASNR